VLSGFTWRPPSAEERQLAMGKSEGTGLCILPATLDIVLLKTRSTAILPVPTIKEAAMQDNWVDFKAIKSAVTMQMVLDRYGVNWLKRKNDELRGRCPIHQGEGQSTFHAHLAKNAFNCFSCKARGNVLDFVAAMEKCSVRDAGLKLQEWFSISPATVGEKEIRKIST
jgi:hypothetical protein